MTCNTLYSDGTGISGHSPTPRRESIESLAKHIRLLVLDVDGVMTDGGLYYDANGLVMKRFHVLDGIGIRLAKTAGIEVAVLSGMDVPCVVRWVFLTIYAAPARVRVELCGCPVP